MQDLRHGCRVVARQPAFSMTVIGTFGLGLSLAITVFSVVHAIVLSPLPYDIDDRLVRIVEHTPAEATDMGASVRRAIDSHSLTGAQVDHLRRASAPLSHVSATPDL